MSIRASEVEARADLDTARRRGRRGLAEERRSDDAAEIQRVEMIQRVVRLRVQLDRVALAGGVDAAHAAERIGVVAADDADLRSGGRRGGGAEADAPAQSQAEI